MLLPRARDSPGGDPGFVPDWTPDQPGYNVSGVDPDLGAPASPTTKVNDGHLNAGQIAGTIVIAVFSVACLGGFLWWWWREDAKIKKANAGKRLSTLNEESVSPVEGMEQDRTSRMFRPQFSTNRTIPSNRSSPNIPASPRRPSSTASHGFEMQQRQHSPSIVYPVSPLRTSYTITADESGSSPDSPLMSATSYHNQSHDSKSYWSPLTNAPPVRRNHLPSDIITRPPTASTVARTPQNYHPLHSARIFHDGHAVQLRDAQAGRRQNRQSESNHEREKFSFESVDLDA